MPGEPILECHDVRKVFRTYRRQPGLRGVWKNFFAREAVEFVALAGIDLAIEPGEFVGLIGANGAGKTTLVKCMTGIIPVTSGSARTLGRDAFHLADADKRRLALVMGQRSQLWWDLPAIDSFKLLKAIYQVAESRFAELVRSYAERLEVSDRLDVQLRALSLGQRMKMEIIGAFLHDPELVFLDEPTIGLDLVSRDTIRQFLIETNRESGATIVLTSHDMEDIEETCRRLLILESGRLLYDGDLVRLQQRIQGERGIELHLAPGTPGWRAELLGELARFGARLERESPLTLEFTVPAESAQAFVRRLFEWFEVRDLNIERQPLERLVKQIFATRELAPEGAPEPTPGAARGEAAARAARGDLSQGVARGAEP